MKIKNDFKLREICGEYVVTAEGMYSVNLLLLKERYRVLISGVMKR